MQERRDLIEKLEEYRNKFGMVYDVAVSMDLLINNLKDEESEDPDGETI